MFIVDFASEISPDWPKPVLVFIKDTKRLVCLGENSQLDEISAYLAAQIVNTEQIIAEALIKNNEQDGRLDALEAISKRVKNIDQVVTNWSDLVPDDSLWFSTLPNTNYLVKLYAFWNTESGPAGFKYRLTHTGTTDRVRRYIENGTSGNQPIAREIRSTFDAADQDLSGASAGYNIINEIIILRVGATGGTVQLSFAQKNATPGKSVTIYEGSSIEFVKTNN